jgi:hypothetical protein
MDFGSALEALKRGDKVAREGWNGKGMWLSLVTRSGELYRYNNEEFEALPWIGMKTADNKFVPWLASQTDILAEDWEVVV